MPLEKRYDPQKFEPELEERWQALGIYNFDPESNRPIYSIDTPPATVSGKLHLGHVYSYSHADFMARFYRMKGYSVFYPMGYDDNGLPTDRLVEKLLEKSSRQIGREAFIRECLAVSEQAEQEYRELWQRLGLSVDWRYIYRTIDEHSRRCAQHSFLDLYRKDLVYRAQSPAIWCPECRTAIAQADLEDRERESEFVTLRFTLENEAVLPIATTRPELLAACAAVFVHPQDARYQAWIGRRARVPLYGQEVPVLPDAAADPAKGTGAVMCCTFGDQTDVTWWRTHHLPLVEAVDAAGRMTAAAGEIAGLPVADARRRMKEMLAEQGWLIDRQATTQSIRVHERCETPVEFRMLPQWFVRVLDHKETFLDLGQQLNWHPEHMHARYRAWVENLSWDWCISRQRLYGVTFPVWYCAACGEIILAQESELPVDPQVRQPAQACACGSTQFIPETDVMDTWATSSLSPAIVTGWLEDPERFERLFPMTMRPQAHEIIRTWAFYTIVKSWYHFGRLPWRDVFISGWGIAGEGMGKISKSKGGGGMAPKDVLRRFSADALRYWAASTSPGKDAVISEEKIQQGSRLITKLWNVARLAEPFVTGSEAPAADHCFTPADRWILARCAEMVRQVTAAFEQYEYAQARSEIEAFFWRDLADNYLEMAKLRLYDAEHPVHQGARQTVRRLLATLLKLLAPLLPYAADALWTALFAEQEGLASVHMAAWPGIEEREPDNQPGAGGADLDPLAQGERLVAIAGAVRRYKSEHSLALGSEIDRLVLATDDPTAARVFEQAEADLMSVTRARSIVVMERSELNKLKDAVILEIPNGEISVLIQT